MTRKPKPAQLLVDDLPIFSGTPIMVPDPTRRPTEPPPTVPPVSEWGWCGTLFDTEEAQQC